MTTRLLLAVGNTLMGDDAAGPLLAGKLRQAPLAGWEALDGGAAPENDLHRVRQAAPEYVLVVDAADMDLPPGEVRLISAERLADPFLMTTHTLPLSYLVAALREFVPQVDLLGIQPALVAFGCPVSPSVRQAVEAVYAGLQRGDWAWPLLAGADRETDDERHSLA
jgi:hydrogenase 3 maturation protease